MRRDERGAEGSRGRGEGRGSHLEQAQHPDDSQYARARPVPAAPTLSQPSIDTAID